MGRSAICLDRFHYGAVADFLYFHIAVQGHQYGYPAFNIGDSCIVVGVGYYCSIVFANPLLMKNPSMNKHKILALLLACGTLSSLCAAIRLARRSACRAPRRMKRRSPPTIRSACRRSSK